MRNFIQIGELVHPFWWMVSIFFHWSIEIDAKIDGGNFLFFLLSLLLFNHRLELHTDSSSTKPELIFMDQIEEVSPEFVQYKNEQSIQIRFRDGIRDGRVVLTISVSGFWFTLATVFVVCAVVLFVTFVHLRAKMIMS